MLTAIIKALLHLLFKKKPKADLKRFLASSDEAHRMMKKEIAWHFRSACHNHHDSEGAPMYHDASNDMYL